MSEQKKKLTKKTMTPDELRAYKKGKRVSNIRGFAIWLSANAAIAGAAYVGGKWAIKQYSPNVIDGVVGVANEIGKFAFNYAYLEVDNAVESGKATALSTAVDTILDKVEELKQEMKDKEEEYQSQNPQNNALKHNYKIYKLNEDEKAKYANFVVDFVNNGTASDFKFESFKWSDCLDLNVKLTTKNGNHDFTVSLNGDQTAIQNCKSYFGSEEIEINGDLYNKYGIESIKQMTNAIKGFASNKDTLINGMTLDGNTVTLDGIKSFTEEEDAINYLLDAGLDIGTDLDRIEEVLGEDDENTSENDSTDPNDNQNNEENSDEMGL